MSTPQTGQPATAVLVPLSVVHQGQRLDLSVPASLPLAELLPGLVSALGRLTTEAATQGFRVIVPPGRELDQARSLAEQGITAGAVLTLETAGAAATDTRFDDLVEAIGSSVDAGRTPWRRGDSVQLSAYVAAGLFAVAAVLLAVGGADPLLSGALGFAGAALVALAALVVARTGVVGGAVALALTVPAMLAAAGFALAGGPPTQLRLAAAGAGAVVGAAACLVLPSRQRAVAAGPLLAGLALVLHGSLTGVAHWTDQRAAALVVALLAVLVLLAPWIGLAQLPARVDALAAVPRTRIDAADVARQVGSADVAVLSLRIAAGLITTVFAPLVAVDLAGALLMASIGLAFLLGTRSLYGRAEVLAGVVGGLLTLLCAGVAAALSAPAFLPWLAGLVIVVGAFVLAWNVVAGKLRPWLNRIADGLHVAALMAVPPLTVWILGLV
nr:EsaB/YukD family protein [Propionicimonas sp.]